MQTDWVSRTAKRNRKRFHLWKYLKFVFNLFLTCLTLLIVEFVYYAYHEFSPILFQYYDAAVKVAENSTTADFKSEQTSYVYDASGKQIAKLRTDRDVNYVHYDDIPECVINATVAIEDKRFWQHQGVDLLSTAKASVLYMKDSENIVRGGSTITQQLIKNIYLTFEKSWQRKLKEICIAYRLEKRYTKEQILEFYLNNINYANGYYGIGAAAKGYFNKAVKDLTLEEAAFLVAIPNNPSLYDPVTKIKNTTKRRNIILKEMWQQGYISEEEYLHASCNPIYFYKPKAKEYNYETSYAINCATQVFMKRQGFEFRYVFESSKDYQKYQKKYAEAFQSAKDLLYAGGYRVYTTIEPKVQKKLQKSIDNVLKDFKGKKNGVYRMQGAATVVDNSTGYVIAVVGGRSQKFGGILTLNRAYQSYRQPGSTFKPLAVYTPVFESKRITPSTIVDDSYFEGGPHNSGDSYLGKITLRKAVEKSKNVVAWKLFNKLGPERGLSYVQKMRFSKIVPDDYYLSSSLGGLTYGVTTVEMASGYATLANDGVFREPTCIAQITDADGVEISSEREVCRVYSEYAARTMTDVLQGVRKRGTAKGLSIGKMPIACKTGTTNNQTNGWFCGYTPYYTVACYVGKDLSKPVDGLWGNTYPLEIWRDIQSFLCQGKKIIKFEKPKTDVVKKDNKETQEKEPDVKEPESQESEPSISEPEPDKYDFTDLNGGNEEDTEGEEEEKEEYVPDLSWEEELEPEEPEESKEPEEEPEPEREQEEYEPEPEQEEEPEVLPENDVLSMYRPEEEYEPEEEEPEPPEEPDMSEEQEEPDTLEEPEEYTEESADFQ